jgi:hypothetical protein
VEDDILTKRYFPWAHWEESKELETGLIAVEASGSLVIGGRDGTVDGRALFSLVKRASKPKRKIDAASWPLLCTVFLYGFDSFHHLLSSTPYKTHHITTTKKVIHAPQRSAFPWAPGKNREFLPYSGHPSHRNFANKFPTPQLKIFSSCACHQPQSRGH